MTINPETGARYVDEAKCKSCGDCLRACPLTPERTVIGSKKPERKRIYFKCDLCFDRSKGPVCVEICPGEALTYVPAGERKK